MSAFATTHWSIVLAAGNHHSPESEQALEALCSSYWYPLYAYTRRQGHDAETAVDLTQSFLARLLEKDGLRSVDREKDRFRAFLLACMRHFLANQRDLERAQKRGGGLKPLSLDFSNAESRYLVEPADQLTPKRLFDRRWALTLLDSVIGRLRAQYTERGKEGTFEAIKPFITTDGGESYRQIGDRLGMSEGAVKVAVPRLRRRYADALREEIARTVESPAQIDDEIEQLFDALG